jgi:hypothetical protein
MSKHTMKRIDITLIDPNPHRCFERFPMRDEHVEELMHSLVSNQHWNAIPVIKHPQIPGRFQQCSGHHTLEAIRRLGATEVDVKVMDYDTDGMIRAMTAENATQDGSNPNAIRDSVGAVIRRLAYLMMVDPGDDEVSKIFDTSGRSAWQNARAKLANGDGIGQPIVSAYMGNAFSVNEVREAIGWLKADGWVQREINAAKADFDAEMARAAEVAAEAERKRKAAEAAQAKREAEAAKMREELARKEEQARKAAERAAQARKAAEAERQAAEAERLKELRKTAMKVEEARRKRQEAALIKAEQDRAAAAERRAKLAVDAERAAAFKPDPMIHPDALKAFTVVDQASHFRKEVCRERRANGLPYFPVQGQIGLINEMREKLEAAGKSFSGENIRDYLRMRRAEIDAVDRAQSEQERHALEQRNKSERATRLVDDVQRAVGALGNALQAVEKAAQADPEVRAFLEDELRRTRLANYMDVTQNALNRMREVFPVKSRNGGPAEVLING